MTNKALILVDFEKEWIDENSEEYVENLERVIENTNKVIDFCRKEGYKIIFTRHVDNESEDVWSENSEGTKLIESVNKEDSDLLIRKNRVSPFFKTSLEKELGGIEEIVVTGILTNMCVRSLIQDAYDRDFEIIVIKDCCAAYDDEIQEFTFKDLKSTREEITFLNSDEFISK